jgi:hypothetical protein
MAIVQVLLSTTLFDRQTMVKSLFQLILSVKMDHHKIRANLFSRISEIMGTK